MVLGPTGHFRPRLRFGSSFPWEENPFPQVQPPGQSHPWFPCHRGAVQQAIPVAVWTQDAGEKGHRAGVLVMSLHQDL